MDWCYTNFQVTLIILIILIGLMIFAYRMYSNVRNQIKNTVNRFDRLINSGDKIGSRINDLVGNIKQKLRNVDQSQVNNIIGRIDNILGDVNTKIQGLDSNKAGQVVNNVLSMLEGQINKLDPNMINTFLNNVTTKSKQLTDTNIPSGTYYNKVYFDQEEPTIPTNGKYSPQFAVLLLRSIMLAVNHYYGKDIPTSNYPAYLRYVSSIDGVLNGTTYSNGIILDLLIESGGGNFGPPNVNNIPIIAFHGSVNNPDGSSPGPYVPFDIDAYQIVYNPTNQNNPDPNLLVHRGFYNVFLSSLGSINTFLNTLPNNQTVIITGHSLGAPVAAMTALYMKTKRPDLNIILYIFASPRFANYDFIDKLTGAISNSWLTINQNDIVPSLVPSVDDNKSYDQMLSQIITDIQTNSIEFNHVTPSYVCSIDPTKPECTDPSFNVNLNSLPYYPGKLKILNDFTD